MPRSRTSLKHAAAVAVLVLAPVVGGPLLAIGAMDLRAAHGDGARFGRYRDQAACVTEVTRGRHVCTNWRCFLENRFFFRACMDVARPSASLCGDIEDFASLMQLEMWKRDRCRALGRVDRTCHHIWLRVLEACDRS